MNASTKNLLLDKAQRIILLVTAFVLAILLFLYRGGTNSKQPLDQLARKSLDPEIALHNGKPTIFEFYADWCEVCREMAPAMISIERSFDNNIDIVLLNVENTRWQYLIDKYDVNGIPQLNFFDENSNPVGKALGLRDEEQLKQIVTSLMNNESLPLGVQEISNLKSLSKLSIKTNFAKENIKPTSHG